MTFLNRAVPLIERGFSVIPLEPREKKPVAGMGVTRRSKDAVVIADWAAKYPEANVAVCADENFLILDADDAVKMRELIGKVQRDCAANAGRDGDAALDFSRGLGSERTYH